MNLARYAGRMGDLPPTVGLPWEYFERRGILLDCRGPLEISVGSNWGFVIRVFTESHDISRWPELGATVAYGVRVDREAWIGSGALLCGCQIGRGAIVAAGTVVRGQDVAPGVMVAGNPARVVARWNGERWVYLTGEESGYRRRLE
jgi:maltose O-acetyltransferase